MNNLTAMSAAHPLIFSLLFSLFCVQPGAATESKSTAVQRVDQYVLMRERSGSPVRVYDRRLELMNRLVAGGRAIPQAGDNKALPGASGSWAVEGDHLVIRTRLANGKRYEQKYPFRISGVLTIDEDTGDSDGIWIVNVPPFDELAD